MKASISRLLKVSNTPPLPLSNAHLGGFFILFIYLQSLILLYF